MKVGTKSLLFGYHTFWLHPFFLAAAWWQLYGPPKDWQLWVVFFLHDIGYWGRGDMDGEEGNNHPVKGAYYAHVICDSSDASYDLVTRYGYTSYDHVFWFGFSKYHSRFLAKQAGTQISPLCLADKLAIVLMPQWLFIFLTTISGEIKEYMAEAEGRYAGMNLTVASKRKWHDSMITYLKAYIEEHKDGRADTWTPRV